MENLHILNITGQPVNFTLEDWGEEKKINMTASPAGFYLIRYKSGSQLFTEKIIIK